MSVTTQAGNADSTLSKFLDARLPQREAIARDWAERSRNAPWSPICLSDDYRVQLGNAIEIRIGLDLADAPGYWAALSFLPPAECRGLLQGVGYAPDSDGHLVDSGITDPLLQQWSRVLQPLACGDDERATLALCWDLAAARDISFGRVRSAESSRSFFISMFRDRPAHRPDPLTNALAHLWQGYLTHGRRQLAAQGSSPVFLEPELASGFGRPDLVVGRSLVEVKTATEPSLRFGQWLNQVLGYVLLDSANIFRLDMLAVYLAWHGLLLSDPIATVLNVSAPGPTPSLDDLRADFRAQIQDDVNESYDVRLRHRYPVPPG